MKVYLLMYYDYDGAEEFGIYSKLEKANKAADQFHEESKRFYGSNQTPYYGLKREFFDVIEKEIQ